MALERFSIANIEDIKNTYQSLKKNKRVLAPALYNAAKRFYRLGLEQKLWEEKEFKMLSLISKDSRILDKCMGWLKDVYTVAYESTGIHILCETPEKYDISLGEELLDKICFLSRPYLVEFPAICEGAESSVAVRFHPLNDGVSCDIDYWEGKEFRHFHSIHVFGDCVNVYNADAPSFDTGVKLSYRKFYSILKQVVLNFVAI